MKGLTDTTFAPDETMTREQMASFIYRNAGSPAATGELTYTDASAISAWAVDAVTYCTTEKIMTGDTDTTFSAAGTADRASGATVLARMFLAAQAAAKTAE